MQRLQQLNARDESINYMNTLRIKESMRSGARGNAQVSRHPV
jgi:hypothetical protein